jgi:hypothetical protein
MWRVFIQQNPALGSIHARLNRHPSWVTRTAILCTLAVIMVPLVLLILAGLLVGALVFAVLSVVARTMDLFGGAAVSRPEPLRRNVRVIDEDL